MVDILYKFLRLTTFHSLPTIRPSQRYIALQHYFGPVVGAPGDQLQPVGLRIKSIIAELVLECCLTKQQNGLSGCAAIGQMHQPIDARG